MAINRSVNYRVGYTIDKAGLEQLQSLFQRISSSAEEPGNKLNIGLQKASQTAIQLEQILSRAFNQNLGTLNMAQFNRDLRESGLTLASIKNSLSGAGNQGSIAFNRLGSAILNTNVQLKQSSKFLDSIAISMSNTIKWGATTAVFRAMTGSISKAVSYTESLDKSLNNIRIVTGQSAEQMETFAERANEAAKTLGASTLDYTNAALIYYQQGLSDKEAQARAEVTVKAANITKQSGAAVSEQLTAVWNGYKVNAEEAELYVDKLSAVAATTASDLEELSIAMSKVASAAASMGVDADQLNAQIATIISATRQAPESVGTALKTIYARMGDLAIEGVDEFGVTLGDVSGKMEQMGIHVLDESGNLREMGTIIEEVAAKWETWSRAQRQAAAVAMAGNRQYNNLVALFDNWDNYTAALQTSQEAMGTLSEQNEIYLESTEAKLQTLKATWQDLYAGLIDNDELNSGIEGLTNLVQVFDNFIDSFGGGIKAISAFGAVMSNVFNKQITNAIIQAKSNQQAYINNMQVLKSQIDAIQQGALKPSETGISVLDAKATEAGYQKQLELSKQIYEVRHGLTNEQYNELINLQKSIGELTRQKTLLEEQAIRKATNRGIDEQTAQDLLNQKTSLEAIKNEYDEETSRLENILKITRDYSEQVNQSRIARDGEVNLVKILNDLNSNLTEEQKRQNVEALTRINSIKEEMRGNRVNVRSLREVRDQLDSIGAQIRNNLRDQRRKNSALTEEEKILAQISDLSAKANTQEAEMTQRIANASRSTNVAQVVTSITSSLSTFTMAWSSISSLMQTFNDETASSVDKLQQTFMTLGFTLPMLISSFSNLNKVFGYSTLKLERNNVASQMRNLLGREDLSISQLRNTQSLQQIITEEKRAYVTTKTNALLAEKGLLEDNAARAITELAFAEEFENQVEREALVLQQQLNATRKFNWVNFVLVGVMAAAAALSYFAQKEREAEEAEKARIEAIKEEINENKELVKTLKDRQEEIQTNQDLYESYKDLYEQYQINTGVKNDLDKISKELIETFNIENGNLLLLSENYDGLTEKIRENVKEQLKAKEELARRAKVESEGQIEALLETSSLTANLGKGNVIIDKELEDSVDFFQKYLGSARKRVVKKGSGELFTAPKGALYFGGTESTAHQEDIITKALLEHGGPIVSLSAQEYGQNGILKVENWSETSDALYSLAYLLSENPEQDIIELYQFFTDLMEDLTNPDSELYIPLKNRGENVYFQDIEQFLEDYKESVESYLENTQAEEESKFLYSQFENVEDLSDATSFEEFRENANLVKDAAERFVQQSDDSVDSLELLKNALNNVNSDYKESYLALQDFLSNSELEGEAKDELEDYLNGLDLNEIIGVAKLYVQGEIDEKSTKENIENSLDKLSTLLGYENTNIDLSVSISEKLLSGDLKTKDAKELSEEIQQLSSYGGGEFKAEFTDFENKSLMEQLRILRKITEAQQEENLIAIAGTRERMEARKEEMRADLENQKTLLEDRKQNLETYEKATGTSMSSDINAVSKEILAIENQLLELNDLDIDIDLDIDTTILDYYEQKVTSILDTAKGVYKATELIGDAWQVPKENAEEFSKIYPELMYQATVLKDGTIQLNQEQVNAVLARNKAEFLADREETEAELQHQLDLVNAEIEYAKTKQEILKNALEGRISASETETQLDENQAKYESFLTEENAKLNAEADEAASKNAETMSKNVQDSLNKVGLKVAQVAKAISAMFKGEDVSPDEFLSVATAERTAIQEFKAEHGVTDKTLSGLGFTDEYYEELYNEYQQNEDRLNTLYRLQASYNEQISELRGGIDETINNIDNTMAGLSNIDADEKAREKEEDRDKDEKYYRDEFDRYWQLQKAVDKTTQAVEKLDEAQDKLHSYELIESLKKENELIEAQKNAYQALYAEQQLEAAELRDVLSQSGVIFDVSGAITNYADVTRAALQAYNNAVAAYNSFAIDEETFDIAEEVYEKFKENIERYDELFYSEMVDTVDAIEERTRKQLENNLQGWEEEIAVKLETSEAKRDWNTFLKDINNDFKKYYENIDDELVKLVKNAKVYIEPSGDIATDLQAIKDVENEINKLKAGSGSDKFEAISQAEDKLRELNEQLQDDVKELYDTYEDAWDSYLDAIDQAADKLDDLAEKYDVINDQLDYEKDLIELLYGPKAYELMDKLYNAQEYNNLEQMKSLRQQADMWKELYDSAEEGSDDQVKYYELWIQAQQDLNDLTVDYINLLKDEWQNTIDSILDDLEQRITGSSLDDVTTEWDRLKDKSDKYYDNVEGLYYIQSLANKIQDSIADTSKIKDQQKLQDLYDTEINYLREKKNLTEYDIKAAELRYNIALKEIALEDARNSKTTMKLVRNTEGNWSYQYVADEDEVMNRAQELTDAYNDLYQLSKDAYEDNLKSLQDLQQEYLDSYRDILENEELSEEEKQQRIKELREWYFEQYALLAEENTLYRNDLAESSTGLLWHLYQTDVANYEAMTDSEKALIDSLKELAIKDYQDMSDEQIALMEKVKESGINDYQLLRQAVQKDLAEIGESAVKVATENLPMMTSKAQEIANAWNAKEGGEGVKQAVEKAEKAVEKATDTYKKKVDEVSKVIREDFSEKGIKGAIDAARLATQSLSSATTNLCNQAKIDLARYKGYINEIKAAWDSVKAAITGSMSELQKFLDLNAQKQNATTTTTQPTQTSQPTTSTSRPTSGSGNGIAEVGDVVTFTGRYYYDSQGQSPAGNRYSGVSKGVVIDKVNSNPYGIHIHSADNKYKDLGWVSKSQISGYDTGGYTGNWDGGDGKLAFLHSKELVLNKEDTSNILSAVKDVRAIAGLGESIENSIMRGIGDMILEMAHIKTNVNYNTNESKQSTDNTFYVTAEFPNADNVETIREAILNLPNLASQMIGRKLK